MKMVVTINTIDGGSVSFDVCKCTIVGDELNITTVIGNEFHYSLDFVELFIIEKE